MARDNQLRVHCYACDEHANAQRLPRPSACLCVIVRAGDELAAVGGFIETTFSSRYLSDADCIQNYFHANSLERGYSTLPQLFADAGLELPHTVAIKSGVGTGAQRFLAHCYFLVFLCE